MAGQRAGWLVAVGAALTACGDSRGAAPHRGTNGSGSGSATPVVAFASLVPPTPAPFGPFATLPLAGSWEASIAAMPSLDKLRMVRDDDGDDGLCFRVDAAGAPTKDDAPTAFQVTFSGRLISHDVVMTDADRAALVAAWGPGTAVTTGKGVTVQEWRITTPAIRYVLAPAKAHAWRLQMTRVLPIADLLGPAGSHRLAFEADGASVGAATDVAVARIKAWATSHAGYVAVPKPSNPVDAIFPGANVMVVGQDGALSKPDWGDSTRLDIELDPPEWFDLDAALKYRNTDLRLELDDGVVRGVYFFAPAPADAVRTRITDAMARTFGKAFPSAEGGVVRFGKPTAACATLGDPMRISLPDCL